MSLIVQSEQTLGRMRCDGADGESQVQWMAILNSICQTYTISSNIGDARGIILYCISFTTPLGDGRDIPLLAPRAFLSLRS